MSSLPPSIPPVSSPPTNQWLRMVGMWLAVAVIGAGLGWSYQEWQSYRNLVLRLEEIQKHRSEREYEECINKATTIPEKSPIYQQTQVIFNECAEKLFGKAKILAAANQYKDAIIEANKLTPDSAPYQEAQKLIDQWSNSLFQKATKLYQEQGKLNEAIALTQVIPETNLIRQRLPETIAQWKQEWAVNVSIRKQALQALEAGQWQQAKQNARRVTTGYWQKQVEPIIDRADAKISTIEAHQEAQRVRRQAQQEAQRVRRQAQQEAQRIAREKAQQKAQQQDRRRQQCIKLVTKYTEENEWALKEYERLRCDDFPHELF
ncbi:hypothetical protein [Moorena bouillonii]|uniref:hypothetical protein n=1 Tax=Moorena bouillonii TaxID=207920 RepID=UPI00117DEE99|nr:hypothetical protein [Moorena bouillonii]